MSFEVGFSENVETVFIADLVETRIVGVVRGADGVDVVTLHQDDVLKHGVGCEGASEVAVEFMAVHAADHDDFAVDEEVAVFEFDFTEPDLEGDDLRDGAFGILEGEEERVEVRRFRGPLQGVLDVGGKCDDFGVFIFYAEIGGEFCLCQDACGEGGTVRGEKFGFHSAFCGFDGNVADCDVNGELTVFVCAVESRFCEDVVECGSGKRGEGDFAEDAAEPPHILVLKIAGVGPLDDLNGDFVWTDSDEFGNVEFGDDAASFAHSGESAVDPDIEEGIDAAEGEDDLAVIPVFGNFEFTDVASGGVFRGDERRVEGEGVLNVGVMGMPVAFHLPVGGNDDLFPVAEVCVLGFETFGDGLRIREESEFPDSVEGHVEGGLAVIPFQRLSSVEIRDKQSSCLETVDVGQRAVFPVMFHEITFRFLSLVFLH